MDTVTAEPFLKEALIAYIGNKRRLIPFIRSVIAPLLPSLPAKPTFLDPFSGSGSVSRLARAMGFTVHANDWEYYSYVMNRPHMTLSAGDESLLFDHIGGLSAVLHHFNTLPAVPPDDEYLAAYYAPESDEHPDIVNERMFYTRRNAKRLDAMRTELERMRALGTIGEDAFYYLLAAIVYEAATHANTSGVFKGFHAGFGGKGKDALVRILGEVSLKPLPLIDAARGTVTQEDAATLLRSHSGAHYDIVYLDPPYNQHQYGSNYHLLNTIALWDKPPVNKQIFIDGKKTNKSAIRSDWVKTRSAYCYRQTALAAFRDCIDGIDARTILLSYSSDGIISEKDITAVLSAKGEVSMVSNEYTRYPGARKSIVNRTRNVEHLFVVNTERRHTPRRINGGKVPLEKLRLALTRTFLPESDHAVFHGSGRTIPIQLSHRLFAVNTEEVLTLLTDAPATIIDDVLAFVMERTAANAHQEIMCYLRVLTGAAYIDDAMATILARIPRLYARFSGSRDKADFVSITQEISTFISDRLSRRDYAVIPAAGAVIDIAREKIHDRYLDHTNAQFVTHLMHGIETAMRAVTV
ncbi:MAG: DNA adenine methylase [Spirochaetota bacterium]